MSYTDRWIKFKKETTWGQWSTPDTFPNYLMEWRATTTENKEEEDIIAGSRDFRKRVWLEEGVTATWSQELVSAKIFEYVLGATSATGSETAATYSPYSTLPSMSIYRGLYPDESGNTVSLGYLGMKVDSAELTIEESGPVVLDLDLVGRGVTIPAAIARSTPNMAIEPFSFYHSSIDIIYGANNTLNLDSISRFVLSINNNLEAMYSAGAGSYKAVSIREGVIEVTGRLALNGDLGLMESIALSRMDTTIKVYLKKTGSTITVTLKNVSFDEIPDELRGLEPIENEFSFTARPATGNDAVTVIEQSTSAVSALPY